MICRKVKTPKSDTLDDIKKVPNDVENGCADSSLLKEKESDTNNKEERIENGTTQ